ncbi:hypothetical protein SD77_1960 [Bacillus badius]|uniref:Ribose 5-phosphate isomerase B n=1 Tax=Bacillus badius TaxID=1455 RepID=A0ABR5AQH7_BACBA|nr:hypothetical protein SD78_1025 [Bacillus badius]KIL77000.1 hypothetical protein SD77_1960 [Bacillus badius]
MAGRGAFCADENNQEACSTANQKAGPFSYFSVIMKGFRQIYYGKLRGREE